MDVHEGLIDDKYLIRVRRIDIVVVGISAVVRTEGTVITNVAIGSGGVAVAVTAVDTVCGGGDIVLVPVDLLVCPYLVQWHVSGDGVAGWLVLRSRRPPVGACCTAPCCLAPQAVPQRVCRCYCPHSWCPR